MRQAIHAALASALLLSAEAHAVQPGLYLGGDLSFANEMADCGAVFRKGGKPVDPFVLMHEAGGNIMRVRLWNDPKWTRYSTRADVEKTIRRARAAGLQVLLDFHYSDDWADGDKQIAPAAWANLDNEAQAKAIYSFTREVLADLGSKGLLPEMVQVGNETNPELMVGPKKTINWENNAPLLKAGLQAVRDEAKAQNKPILSMLHIAQPENAEPWFAAAKKAGVTDYDIIGLSYYSKWSQEPMAGLAATMRRLKADYGKPVIVVETAYAYTQDSGDDSVNLLGPDSLVPGYPATPDGQRRYMIDLTQTVVDAGGIGVVYWAPDWVSTNCKTRWGTGSSWENATWFDMHDRFEALPVLEFMSRSYRR